ncbi:hypothetical protein C457_04066 [Haloferax prahovense DSM 18310]|uniref:Small CPxCG-related zinc finger protein n=1 Tax=Haloferax prahovense (strain DSM 18310 / JCM 13924 / TL6) TaxID=1227461 RepID=M0GLJ7_HALPT|nr:MULTISPECIES: hypothetical protein [Haloferax]ELZ73106.1 hypothetical protein C457_04066 [Haloferax prahovense DSM 18310]
MPTCRNCGETCDAAELTRHVSEGWLVVHCPACHAPLGSYRLGTPSVDRIRNTE